MEENVANENKTMQEQLKNLRIRIPYDEEIFETYNNYTNVLKSLLEDTKNLALSEIYPFTDYYELELPKKYLNWQLRACVELYNLADKKGILSYSENGLSWTKDTGGLSKSLMSEITRRIGVPRSEDELDV